MKGYCVKCREPREIADAQTVTLANGRKAVQGVCAVCKGKLTIFGKQVAEAKG